MNRMDTASGGVIAGGGAIFLWAAAQQPDAVGQDYGPGFFPSLIAGGLILGGLWLVIRSLIDRRRQAMDAPDSQVRPSWMAAVLIVAVLLMYVVVADFMGFHLTAMLCITPLMWLFTRRFLWSVAITALGVVCIHVIFYNVLRVPLPWGVLQPLAW